MSSTTTDGIRVTVKPSFWPERSSPEMMSTVTVALPEADQLPTASRSWTSSV
jgi:ApaG protein